MVGYTREVAHRVFAKELLDTTILLDRDESDKFAPLYVITPTGAKINRCLQVGVLIEVEDVGLDTEYWRARVQDGTGVIAAYAGQYQIEAAHVLSTIEVPANVAIMGKTNTFLPENGGLIVTLRPESIAEVDAAMRARWVLQTAQHTMNRIRRYEADNPDRIESMKPYRQMVRTACEGVIK